ncbi:hypothetical protein [Methylorubrum extorquens]|jgi:hypothetical protein|uniref:hypothetical protein n=1 Tax=Methylorubrum extorquens TaxID=408 RepID=UPI001EE50C6E|nr:hypothetical protein [Methylorubrum extorquens]MCG5248404.1 hypothetical protein [Methylorubrum extorquens]
MISERQLQTFEARIANLEAIVDGSQEQTRDATAYIVGIVTRFLHEKGLIDERALRDYVKAFEGDASDREDYMGDLARRLGNMIDFHGRHPTDLNLPDAARLSGHRPDQEIQPGV